MSGADAIDPVARAIGAAVRRARHAQGMTTRELALKADVSQPFVSTVENGLSTPSVATLYRLASALGVGAHELLPAATAGEVVVVRAGEAPLSPVDDAPGSALSALLCGGPGQMIEVHRFDIEPGQPVGDWFEHPGEDFVHVLDGELRVELGLGRTEVLRAGDSLWHAATVPHRWTVGPRRGAVVLLVNAHPASPGRPHTPH